MRLFFFISFVSLCLLSGIAWRIEPESRSVGKTPLTWVSDDNPARREQIKTFNDLNPNYDLKLDPSNSGMEKVIVQSLAGVGPDLFDCYDGFQVAAYVKSGIAWDLSAMYKKYGLKIADTWPAVWPTFVYEGKPYGHPTNAAVNAIWFNKDIFERERVPFPKGPWDWDEFVTLAQRLTHKDENGRVTQFAFFFDWYNWQQFVIQWGGRLYTPDGTKCIVDSPQAIRGIQFMQDLIYKYKVSPSPVEEQAMATQGGWGSGTITYFGAGKGAMALGGRWWLCTLRTYEKLHLGAAPCPFGPVKVYRGYGRATLINAKSPRREAAFRFIIYESQKAYNDLINEQADALAPVNRFCYTPEYLHDPKHPEEDYNDVWRDIMDYGRPEEISPFINGQAASRIFNKQIELVKNGQKTAEEALKKAADEINKEIKKTLERDPSLRRRYEQLTRSLR